MRKELIFFIIALALFCFVVVDIYWWIQISLDYSKSFEEAKSAYEEKFPKFIGKGHGVALMNIVILASSGFLFFKSRSLHKLKILSFIFFICCAVIGAWQFFTLL